MEKHRATYSPEDNKLRLYPAYRLDKEEYNRVKTYGFKWAPKQELFVAPMWTPEREDLLIDMCDEIEDEDKSLVDRAEERADRFSDYSENRAEDAAQAHDAVRSIADNIPFGQPILVGHHSEKRARKDAEKIENGMRRAVKMWEQSKYWKARAAGALRHAKYKERPDVRARRIKTLEADRRREDKRKQECEMWLKLWTECANEPDKDLQQKAALRIAGMCRLSLPRKEGDRPDFNQNPSAYDALTSSHPNLYAPRTLEEILTHAIEAYPRYIARYERWISHYSNRIDYEKAMLAEDGGTAADQVKPEVGGAIRCLWSPGGGKGWAYIKKVNKVTVTIWHKWNSDGRAFAHKEPLDKIREIMSKADVDKAFADGRIHNTGDGIGFYLLDTQPEPTPAPTPAPHQFKGLQDDGSHAPHTDAFICERF